jgi:hypothetical protein
MDLLPEELRKKLPRLYSQESSSAPVLFCLCCRQLNALHYGSAPAMSC